QFVNRPAVCVTVMLLLAVADSKRACDYSMIISTYRALILVELQKLNLTGPFDISKETDHCPSEKVHRILRYIYGMTQIFSCLNEGHADSMTKVVCQMAELIRQNCRKPESLGKGHKKTSSKPVNRRKGRQRRKMKMMGMLINCWQKLLSVSAY
ncbi:hypothetical protein IRJ41_021654, partial [Triplophysa rosa]